MKNFQSFGLSADLVTSLDRMNYSEPTPIQEQAIPLALKGRDILGSAQTGTGKTAAFSIPLVEKLMRSSQGTALVLTPTRELAKQVLDVIHQLLGPRSHIKTAFIIGGEPMGKQYNQLRAEPRIIVGTPGRINDHLERGTINLSDAGFLVLDETDRMLDMGFGVQLDRILRFLPTERQTLLFSATLPKEIVQLASKYTTNAERISVGATNVVAVNIKTDIIRINHPDKYKELQTQLLEREGSVIIFIKTKHAADRMADNLRRDGFTADALHGDLRQHKRDRVMQNFRKQNFRILVATDIAARGLDVPHIEHVINYDMPQVAEDYIHRMGRTARAGATGSALCFISPEDGRKWHAIERLLNPNAEPERMPYAGKSKSGAGKRGFGGKRAGAGRGDERKEWGAPRKKSFAGGGAKGRDEYKPRFASDAPKRDADGNRANGNRNDHPQYGDRPARQSGNENRREDQRQDNRAGGDTGFKKPYQPRFEGDRKEGAANKKSSGGYKGVGFKSTPRSEGFREDRNSARPERNKRNDRPQERSEPKESGFKKSYAGDAQRPGRNSEKKPFGAKPKSGGFKPARKFDGDAPLSRSKPAGKSGGFKSGSASPKKSSGFGGKQGGFKSGKPSGNPKRAA